MVHRWHVSGVAAVEGCMGLVFLVAVPGGMEEQPESNARRLGMLSVEGCRFFVSV